ncbi:MAG: ABC transporter substrate-binding protein [Anaerovoracaceae bacterium]|jgi:NitT/TauT family transport system substrate-binding protein
MKKMKKVIMLVLVMAVAIGAAGLTACGSGSDNGSSGKTETVNIAMQHGMAYAPLKVMEKKKLVQKYYKGAKVKYSTLNSGSAITEGMNSGDIQFAALGVAPAVTAVVSDVPAEICANVSAQPQALMTNQSDINSVKDIGKKDKIALVNIGSIQHVMLGMLAQKELGDAHALDDNIAAMSHPDGMSSLESGSVQLQLTTSPYVFKEADMDGIHEVAGLDSVWPRGQSFIVMMALDDVYKNNKKLYDAVLKAESEAIDWINNHPDEAAKLLCKEEGVSAATMKKWLQDPDCTYSTTCKGVFKTASFMADNGFLESKGPKAFGDLVFDGVKGN